MIDLDNQFNEMDAQLSKLEHSNNQVHKEEFEDSSDLSGLSTSKCQSEMPESSMPDSSFLDDDSCSSADANEIVFSNAIISNVTSMNLQQR